MPVVRAVPVAPRRLLAALISIGVLALAIDHAVAFPLPEGTVTTSAPLLETAAHLVVSEVMTGGASASDEFIELYNPAATLLPLEGLEVVYVTASGATVTRKASWAAGPPGMAPGTHLLIANGAGVFAGLADVAYANGLAATGGSVALRVIGAATAIDAVGWGNAASTWLETRPAPAPAAGSSLERLPGGSSGSGQDTDDNLLDLVIQPVPDPQNSGSPPIPVATGTPAPTASPSSSSTAEPSASSTLQPPAEPSLSETPTVTASPVPTASPSPTATPAPTATPTPSPSPSPKPTPTPTILSIAEARSQPDGTTVTVEGMTLTVSDFTDGGGYLVDESAGIAVLLSDGAFGRGERLQVTGTIDDRYAQRTIRAGADSIRVLGAGSDPSATTAATGSIGEAVEGQLVEISGAISSSATTLSTGLAWDVDDGSGAIRVLIGTTTGIDTSAWARGVGVRLIGVVGQRDSSGTGTSGYRVEPRDATDILSVEPPTSPTPTPEPTATATSSASASPSPTPTPGGSFVSITQARAAAAGTRLRIRGVVTAPSGLIESGSAIVQDATAGILVRIGTDVGSLSLGQLVELDGTRATKTGMLSLRVSITPVVLGTQADPEPIRRATGAVGEGDEARLLIVRGAISTAISHPRGGNVSFAMDDGSGPIRVTISSRSSISTGALTRGSWLELRAVLAQETTGSAPSSGYRLWPRVPSDLRVIAAPVAGSAQSLSCCASGQAEDEMLPGKVITDGLQGTASVPPGQQIVPTLARAQPTISPRPILSNGKGAIAAGDQRAPAAGLVVSGMGLAALAGLAAWFGRRRGPDDDPPMAEDDPQRGGPRLSVLRIEADDARNERRILPPT